MAIDMIEDNELSALAPMRNGGHFKNEMFSRPSIQRNKRPIRLDSEFSNFSLTPQWNFDKERVTGEGKALIAKYEFNIDKVTCDELKAMKLKLQNASDDFSRSWNSYSNSHVQDEVRNWVNIFLRRVTEFDDAIKTKKCLELEQKRLDDESNARQQQVIQQSAINAQLGLSQAEALAKQAAGKGMSSSTKFMIIGGVAIVGIVLVSILRR